MYNALYLIINIKLKRCGENQVGCVNRITFKRFKNKEIYHVQIIKKNQFGPLKKLLISNKKDIKIINRQNSKKKFNRQITIIHPFSSLSLQSY